MELARIVKALMQVRRMQNRVTLAYARTDDAPNAATRRARTRQLIEWGGLVDKSGLAVALGNNRAAMLGALLDVTARSGEPDQATHYLDRGLRAFNLEREDAKDALDHD